MTGWLLTGSEYAAIVAGVAYLIAVRRRSPRAARLGIAALAVLLGWELPQLLVMLALGPDASLPSLLQRAGASDRTSFVVFLWAGQGVRFICYALLIWAVVADRRPAEPADATDPAAV